MCEQLKLERVDNSSWGFRLTGGLDFGTPLTVLKVTGGSIAELCGVEVGDLIIEINGHSAKHFTHTDAQNCITASGDRLTLTVMRGSELTPPLQTPLRGMTPMILTQEPLSDVDYLKQEANILTEKLESVQDSSLLTTVESEFQMCSDYELLEEHVDVRINEEQEQVILDHQRMQEVSDLELDELLTGNEEVLDQGVLGINFQKFHPQVDFIRESEVFKVLQTENTYKEIPEEIQLLHEPTKRFSTFLMKPKPPPSNKPTEPFWHYPKPPRYLPREDESKKEEPKRRIIKDKGHSVLWLFLEETGDHVVDERWGTAEEERVNLSRNENREEDEWAHTGGDIKSSEAKEHISDSKESKVKSVTTVQEKGATNQETIQKEQLALQTSETTQEKIHEAKEITHEAKEMTQETRKITQEIQERKEITEEIEEITQETKEIKEITQETKEIKEITQETKEIKEITQETKEIIQETKKVSQEIKKEQRALTTTSIHQEEIRSEEQETEELYEEEINIENEINKDFNIERELFEKELAEIQAQIADLGERAPSDLQIHLSTIHEQLAKIVEMQTKVTTMQSKMVKESKYEESKESVKQVKTHEIYSEEVGDSFLKDEKEEEDYEENEVYSAELEIENGDLDDNLGNEDDIIEEFQVGEYELCEAPGPTKKKTKKQHPLTPQTRPIVLPGGRMWRQPKDAALEEFYQGILIEQADVLVGTNVGVNFRKYVPPKFDIENSAVCRLIRELEEKSATGKCSPEIEYYQTPISKRHFYAATLPEPAPLGKIELQDMEADL